MIKTELTTPMKITLYALLMNEEIPYPQGQVRFIMLGLFKRGMITHDGKLTLNGKIKARNVLSTFGIEKVK